MFSYYLIKVLLAITFYASTAKSYYINPNYDCGPYGFTCEKNNRVRLCEGTKMVGPAFICPAGTFCNEESTEVCEDAINFVDPELTRKLRCHRNERIANPNVPGCKGYILCVPNGNRFHGINFKCSGNTIFNGFTRSCTSPQKYKCPVSNATKSTPELFGSGNKRDSYFSNEKTRPDSNNRFVGTRPTPIECKNYKFRVTQDDTPGKATYFCPPRPVSGESSIRCTIFSNQFCVTLQRDEDQFVYENSAPFRKPRT